MTVQSMEEAITEAVREFVYKHMASPSDEFMGELAEWMVNARRNAYHEGYEAAKRHAKDGE